MVAGLVVLHTPGTTLLHQIGRAHAGDTLVEGGMVGGILLAAFFSAGCVLTLIALR